MNKSTKYCVVLCTERNIRTADILKINQSEKTYTIIRGYNYPSYFIPCDPNEEFKINETVVKLYKAPGKIYGDGNTILVNYYYDTIEEALNSEELFLHLL